MDHTEDVVVSEMKFLVAKKTEEWIRNSLTLTNINDILNIFEESLQEITEKHTRAEEKVWDEFTILARVTSY